MGSANIRNFYIINRALMIQHNYPLEARALPEQVMRPRELDREYHSLISHFQGQNREWYESSFDYYKTHPMGDVGFVHRYRELFKRHAPGLPADDAVASAGLEIEVRFPPDRIGQSEPLVTTGVAGAGDFFYVAYLDPQHVKIGFDHWGVGGFVSSSLPVDYKSAHRLRISSGNFFPMDSDNRQVLSASGITTLKDHILVMIDDVVALDADTESYKTQSASITVGQNLIGGSTAGPKFTGQILRSQMPSGLKRP
jgi:hypothetical protein